MAEVNRAHALVVEDDRRMRTLLIEILTDEGFETIGAETGEEALRLAEEHVPRVAVLDVCLPGVSGHEVCRELRRRLGKNIGIIYLSGERTESYDRVAGFLIGADDYLVKPFIFEELIARLQAKLRRPQLIEEQVLRWHDVSINPATREAWRVRDALDLTQREFDLLEVFMREPRRVFSKDHLLELVWGHDFEGGPNIVETYISYLRAKIDRPEQPTSFIRTVRGVGYGLSQ